MPSKVQYLYIVLIIVAILAVALAIRLGLDEKRIIDMQVTLDGEEVNFKTEFQTYKANFGIVYNSTKEEQYRFYVFSSNLYQLLAGELLGGKSEAEATSIVKDLGFFMDRTQ